MAAARFSAMPRRVGAVAGDVPALSPAAAEDDTVLDTRGRERRRELIRAAQVARARRRGRRPVSRWV